jgi:hypothetical protein
VHCILGLEEFEIEIPVPEILVKALTEASRALTELDPLANHHDAALIDDALTFCRNAGNPGTPAEQIAAILKASCAKGDEWQVEEILREAKAQFIRESDGAESQGEYDGSHAENHFPECEQSESECTCADGSWYGPEHDSACALQASDARRRTDGGWSNQDGDTRRATRTTA